MAVGLVLAPRASAADEAAPPPAPAATEAAPPAAEPAKPKPKPSWKKGNYSLPWLMRPVLAPTIVRLDGTYAMSKAADKNVTTVVSVLTGAYTVVDGISIFARVPFARMSVDGGDSASAFGNPLAFAQISKEVAPKMRVAGMLGVAVGLGQGGGDDAKTDTGVAKKRGALLGGLAARQGMDNAMFAMNYTTAIVGAGFGYLDGPLTLHVEATVLQLMRTRGEAVDTDSSRTNSTLGFHAGYRVIDYLTISTEWHYQRWLSTPTMVKADGKARDVFTGGIGLRGNFPVTDTAIIRPGIAFFMPFDDPAKKAEYKYIQADVTAVF